MRLYVLEVTYADMPEWPSPKRFDERLEKHLGKEADGSGYGGVRDITWSFKTRAEVREAVKKAKAFIKNEKKPVYRMARVRSFVV